MTRKKFIGDFTAFILCAVRLNEVRRKFGLSSLENEVEDLDDEFFKQGLRLVIDEAEPAIIDEILSNKINFEKNRYSRLYKNIVKRTVLGIQEGLTTRILVFVLLSLANLPQKDQRKIEYELLKDPPTYGSDEPDIDGEGEPLAVARECYAAGDRCRELEDYEEAIKHFEDALVNYRNVYNEEHQDIIDTLCYIGICYEALLDYGKAIKYFEETAASDAKVNGKNNQNTAIYYNQISSCYEKLKDYQKALKYSMEALEIREKFCGTEHSDTAYVYSKIADIYYLQGDYKNALGYFEKAYKIFKKNNGDDDIAANNSCFSIGACYEEIGEYKKAISYYEEALAVYEKNSGKEHSDTAVTHFSISGCYYILKDYENALKYDLEALRIREKICEENAPELALSYNNTGTDYRSLGQFKEALKHHLKALELRKRYCRQKDFIAFSHCGVAKDYEGQGDKKNALRFFKDALLIYESLEGFESDAENTRQAVKRNEE